MRLVFRGDESQYRAMAARIEATFASLALWNRLSLRKGWEKANIWSIRRTP